MNKKEKEDMVAKALDTPEGRKMLWDMGFVPAIKKFAKEQFSTWDKDRQERWMTVAFGPTWRTRLERN